MAFWPEISVADAALAGNTQIASVNAAVATMAKRLSRVVRIMIALNEPSCAQNA